MVAAAAAAIGKNYLSMPKKIIKRYMPDHREIREHRALRKIFGELLHDPNLWHLNRRSASGAFAVGLFMAFLPVPLQMVLAAATAILVRVNIVVSVALVWVTNPLTMAPIFFFAYKLGAWMLGIPPRSELAETEQWLLAELGAGWKPLLLGSLVLSTVASLSGYLTIRGLWRLRLVRHWRRKKAARASREGQDVG